MKRNYVTKMRRQTRDRFREANDNKLSMFMIFFLETTRNALIKKKGSMGMDKSRMLQL